MTKSRQYKNLPYNPKLRNRARELRKSGGVLSETLIWGQLSGKKFLGLRFNRQVVIGNYIVDFLCKKLGVVIEIDGCTHDFKEDYDKRRDLYLKSLGLKVIHIYDIDVKNSLDGVMEFLRVEFDGVC